MLTVPIARAFRWTLEPLVSAIYFAPEAVEEYEAIGIDPVAGYFCSRSAAMGRASGPAVAAAFYNFNPSLVAASLRWETHDPADVLAARHRAILRLLPRLLAAEDGSQPELARAASLLRAATVACVPEGRALFAAHAALPWPEDASLAFWHGANLLREYRGDGHIAVLLTHGVGAVDALLLAAPYHALRKDVLIATRGWTAEAVDDAARRLAGRGFLSGDELTDAGVKFREMMEMETDRLAAAPFDALGPERCDELLAILEPLSARVVERKGVPGALAARPRQQAENPA